jgi:hypothetical protein
VPEVIFMSMQKLSLQKFTMGGSTSQDTAPAARKDWLLRLPIAALEVFVGVGGVYGGVEMLRHPLNPMGTTTDLIDGSPFDTFTWPGVLLLTLVGVTPLVLALGLLLRVPGAVVLSAGFGVGLMAWICVQWALLEEHLWLQPLMFGIGAVIAALSTIMHRQRP